MTPPWLMVSDVLGAVSLGLSALVLLGVAPYLTAWLAIAFGLACLGAGVLGTRRAPALRNDQKKGLSW